MSLLSQAESAFSQTPPELWDQILGYPEMDNGTLLNLALVSKRLYHKCLFLYLSRLGLDKEGLQKRIILQLGDPLLGHDATSALCLPYLVDRTEEVICYFPSGVRSSLPRFQCRVRRAHGVLSQLTSVKWVKLRFKCHPECQPITTGPLEGASDAMRRLFNAILRSGTETLEVHDEDVMSSWFYSRVLLHPKTKLQAHPSPSPLPPRRRSSLLSALHRSHSTLREAATNFTSVVNGQWDSEWNASASDIFSNDAKAKSKLQHIQIQCGAYSTIPLARWI
jgi:hypothetical protein